ncbi:hypothetical protein EDD18DRAFT_570170 [Armillaria luteobubalina]|uniref:Uncharacterized protein n=1 Tax=Armillaria luteobubalina TaxID=153913 RepID=A0AA39PSP4_9AGAR|nr:hypothetical protein EDD18DRAFT_570170 [Armillaria luteobubalina]
MFLRHGVLFSVQLDGMLLSQSLSSSIFVSIAFLVPSCSKYLVGIRKAHDSVSASEKYDSKRRAKPPKPTLANLCWIALLGNSHLYHAGAGLERQRSSLRIIDTIVRPRISTCIVYNCAKIICASVIVALPGSLDCKQRGLLNLHNHLVALWGFRMK